MPSEKKRTTPSAAGWQPFSPSVYGMGRPIAVDTVKLYRSGTVRISYDLVLKLAEPPKVQLFTNGERDRFAISPSIKAPGSLALTRVGQQYEFKANRLLTSLGKRFNDLDWPLELPHSWDGNLLVLDISEVPDTEAVS